MKWLVISALLVSACARFPELDATVNTSAENADFPALIPIDDILAQPNNAAASGENPSADIAARVARLRARAARLRGSIVDPATRTRMQSGVATQ